jgi:hypothetical protein
MIARHFNTVIALLLLESKDSLHFCSFGLVRLLELSLVRVFIEVFSGATSAMEISGETSSITALVTLVEHSHEQPMPGADSRELKNVVQSGSSPRKLDRKSVSDSPPAAGSQSAVIITLKNVGIQRANQPGGLSGSGIYAPRSAQAIKNRPGSNTKELNRNM